MKKVEKVSMSKRRSNARKPFLWKFSRCNICCTIETRKDDDRGINVYLILYIESDATRLDWFAIKKPTRKGPEESVSSDISLSLESAKLKARRVARFIKMICHVMVIKHKIIYERRFRHPPSITHNMLCRVRSRQTKNAKRNRLCYWLPFAKCIMGFSGKCI